MKINILTKVLIAIIFLTGASPLFSQTNDENEMKKLIDEVKADKKALIISYMQLTDEQNKMFVPVYDEYQAELQKVNERIGNLILDYAGALNNSSVTDDAVKKMLNEMIAIDTKESELKTKFSKVLLNLLPALKVGRYFQMENKIRAAIKYELAVQIPLVR